MYRNYLITSAAGVPGSIIACYTVDMKYIGRKGTMAISTLISGIFLYLFTVSSDPGYQAFCSSIEAFFQVYTHTILALNTLLTANRTLCTACFMHIPQKYFQLQ